MSNLERHGGQVMTDQKAKEIIERSIKEREEAYEEKMVILLDKLFEVLDTVADLPEDPKQATHSHWNNPKGGTDGN